MRTLYGELKNQEWVTPTLNTTADGSLYLSVLDLIAWDDALRSGSILTADSWARIYTPAGLTDGTSYPYGFGWFVAQAADAPRYYHGSSWQGFRFGRSPAISKRSGSVSSRKAGRAAQAQPDRASASVSDS
jgi:hypothetical protein